MTQSIRKRLYLENEKTIDWWRAEQLSALEAGTHSVFAQGIAAQVAKLPSGSAPARAVPWPDHVADALRRCYRTGHDLHRLAHLAYTGKVELSVRDDVVAELMPPHSSSVWYGRDYQAVDAVEGTGSVVQAAFQSKQILVADLYPTGRIPGKDLRELNLDIRLKAPCNLDSSSPDVQLGLLLVADYGSLHGHTLLPCGSKYGKLVHDQWNDAGATDWQVELVSQLHSLDLHVVHQSSLPAWPLPQPYGCPLALHWFLVMPN